MTDVQTPTVPDELAKAIGRQSSLDRQPPTTKPEYECIVCGWLTQFSEDSLSLEWDPWVPCRVVELHLRLDVDDEDVRVDLLRDGATQAGVTVGGTSNPQRMGLATLTDPITYTPGQLLQFQMDGSSGLGDWTAFIVQARIRCQEAMSGALPMIPNDGGPVL